MLTAGTEVRADGITDEVGGADDGPRTTPAGQLKVDLNHAIVVQDSCRLVTHLIAMRHEVVGDFFQPDSTAIVAVRLPDAREHVLALAEEIAELLEQAGTPSFVFDRTPSPRRITDAEFAEVKRQLAAMERSDGLPRFVFLALLAAGVAGGFIALVRWLTGA